MKKILTFLALLGVGLKGYSNEAEVECEPNIHYSFNYWGIGVGPLPIPGVQVDIGRRTVIGESSAIDLGLSGSTFVVVSSVRAYSNVLWYVNQKLESQYYVGLGGSVAGITGKRYIEGYAAPNLVIGKEFFTSYGNKRFFQIETMYPVLVLHDRKFVNFPFFNITYGISF